MRKLIAAMKISVDGKYEGAQGYADWVHGWSDDYGLTPQIDACVLGGRMYDGYEPYWTAIGDDPGKPLPETGSAPTPGELEWAEFARRTPHYVVSATRSAAAWANTRFLRGLDEVAALKTQPGQDIYLMGGAALTAAALDAGLVDELRLIVYPLIAGNGPALFASANVRHRLELRKIEQLPDGRSSYVYDIG
ncbi:dihydrofolate reductase [Nocardia sp. 852002-20019_SCH5090214]|uniref:dihydrofolate reductase family protein n=1 Tax=Nocardia sp. 852002-20019_SCH5090214 TaxID=1834087 RepID=UPI0007EA0D49|nr:dihydrofolate reductase family protein [Nocardia sp. 852002-20019_SCH5090214]OBA52950.1 dihydrofolate reductase [Nocardia sp. 852002-20019_SCH5090214]